VDRSIKKRARVAMGVALRSCVGLSNSFRVGVIYIYVSYKVYEAKKYFKMFSD
jgi:hypothetical protein